MPDRASEPRAAPSVPIEQERAVVERLKAGDRAAFATLYGWYGDAVFRAILARLPDRVAAEDCLRDTFRTALEKIAQFTSTDQSIYGWLRRIAVNKAMDVHRARKRDRALEERVVAQPNVPVHGATPPRPDRGLEADDAHREVQLSLSRMNPRYAEALRMRLLEERTREECAEAFAVSVANFDVLLHRACKAFRKVYPP